MKEGRNCEEIKKEEGSSKEDGSRSEVLGHGCVGWSEDGNYTGVERK